MSDDPRNSRAETEATSEARAAEAAAIRRRWITLGEALTVVAVVISGLTLWNNWSQRSETEASKAAEAKQASTRAATLVLTAESSGDEELLIKPRSAEQTVQSQTIMFPTALGATAAATTGEPRIEASWFESPLQKAREKAGLPDDSRGDERLPVVITTRFLIDGEVHEDVALYDIGYTVAGRWLSGHQVTLRGLSLVSRVKGNGAQAKLDARWKKLFPQK